MGLKAKGKYVIIILVVLTSTGLLVAGCWFYFNSRKSSDIPSKKETTEIATRPYGLDSSDIYGIAYQTAQDKGYDVAQSYLDGEIKKVTSVKDKAEVYIYKSNIATHNPEVDSKIALEYAKKAEELYQSQESALAIATIYDKLNDKVGAVKYYKIYLERMEKFLASFDGNFREVYQRNYEKYKARVEELGA